MLTCTTSTLPDTQSIEMSVRNNLLDPDWTEELVRLGAKGIVCWRNCDDSSSAVAYHTTTVLDPWVIEKSQELATRAIRSGSQKCAVLSSPQGCLIVAQPIGRNATECVSVAFPCDLSELAESDTEERLAAVERLSESISKNQIGENFEASPWTSESERPDAYGPKDSGVGDSGVGDSSVGDSGVEDAAGEAQASALPGWPELFQQLLRRAFADLRELRSRVWFYAVVLGALTGIGSIPFPYTVSCKAVCEPSVRRFVAAPFEARLAKVHVVSGQSVKQGDVLITLDGSDLRSELAGLRAEAAQAQQRLLAALSRGDHSQAEFERLETEHMAREIDLITRRQQELEIRAPRDGIIVTGDLERSEGMRLSMGDQLFEIASLDRLIAEIAIPESEVNHVGEQAQVNIQLDAAPGRDGASKITKIHLRSELRDNASVFIAEAELDNSDGLLRPGMNGTTRVSAGNHAIAWILFHRPANQLRRWVGW